MKSPSHTPSACALCGLDPRGAVCPVSLTSEPSFLTDLGIFHFQDSFAENAAEDATAAQHVMPSAGYSCVFVLRFGKPKALCGDVGGSLAATLTARLIWQASLECVSHCSTFCPDCWALVVNERLPPDHAARPRHAESGAHMSGLFGFGQE